MVARPRTDKPTVKELNTYIVRETCARRSSEFLAFPFFLFAAVLYRERSPIDCVTMRQFRAHFDDISNDSKPVFAEDLVSRRPESLVIDQSVMQSCQSSIPIPVSDGIFGILRFCHSFDTKH